MRVAFNARLLTSPSLRGWNRYTLNLATHLPACGVTPMMLSNAQLHPDHLARLETAGCEVHVGGPRRVIPWEQWWLPREAHCLGAQVLHSPFNFGLPARSRVPRVLTLHDAIDDVYYRKNAAPRRLPRTPGEAYAAISPRLSRRVADQIITVSEHAKGDICRCYGINPSRVTVIHEAADPHFKPATAEQVAAARDHYDLKQPYFFYVGGLEKRKNIPFMLRAFAQASTTASLAIGGGATTEIEPLRSLCKKLGVADRVHWLGWIEEAHLPALYTGALAFIYPSEYEGFGLQLCEAMACGCPVLAANATSLPEVLGEGGETFQLSEPVELTAALDRLTCDDGLRSRQGKRGRNRVADLSWNQTAEKTADVYRGCV